MINMARQHNYGSILMSLVLAATLILQTGCAAPQTTAKTAQQIIKRPPSSKDDDCVALLNFYMDIAESDRTEQGSIDAIYDRYGTYFTTRSATRLSGSIGLYNIDIRVDQITKEAFLSINSKNHMANAEPLPGVKGLCRFPASLREFARNKNFIGLNDWRAGELKFISYILSRGGSKYTAISSTLAHGEIIGLDFVTTDPGEWLHDMRIDVASGVGTLNYSDRTLNSPLSYTLANRL